MQDELVAEIKPVKREKPVDEEDEDFKAKVVEMVGKKWIRSSPSL